ncbi:hypothetical protein HRbin30_02528 [bacterium HR30]|nr:hypothetical protein HRbin30_02528 [bacterium HR30]
MSRKGVVVLAVLGLAIVAGGIWWWNASGREVEVRNNDVGLRAEVRPRDGEREVLVDLQAVAGGGPVVTVVSELAYDPKLLRFERCESDAAQAGKQLHVREVEPGRVRAVVAGSLDPMPGASKVLACVFAAPAAARGRTVVRARGEVADTTYVDRPFDLQREVRLGG